MQLKERYRRYYEDYVLRDVNIKDRHLFTRVWGDIYRFTYQS